MDEKTGTGRAQSRPKATGEIAMHSTAAMQSPATNLRAAMDRSFTAAF